MISIEELITSVQQAVCSATQSVATQNLSVFQKYFYEVTDGDELSSIVRNSLSMVDDAIDDSDDDAARAALREAAQALASAASRLSASNDGNGKTGQKERPPAEPFYAPKTVTIQYPHLGKGGKPEVVNVQVPLLTLVPMRMPEVLEVRFRAHLEVGVHEGGGIQTAFATSDDAEKQGDLFEHEKGGGKETGATIDILIGGPKTSDGLLKVVEGYEKALRAQIPG